MVAFKPKEVIASEFLGNKACAFLLAVHGIGRDQDAGRQIQFFEQRLERGDLIAFLFDRHLIERQAQMMGYRREQLQRLAVMPATADCSSAICSVKATSIAAGVCVASSRIIASM